MKAFFLRGMVVAALALHVPTLSANVTLSADDQSPISGDPNPTYTIIKQALGSSPEVPDCSHPGFGPHITRVTDDLLGKSFVFFLHLDYDSDRCITYNHHRNEIKVDAGSPASIKAFPNDAMTYRWTFKLADGFQPSYNFTYIHQIKAFDGDNLKPLIVLEALKNKGTPAEVLNLTHVDSAGVRTVLRSVDLSLFKNEWIEAYAKLTASHTGKYSITLTRVRDGAVLLSYSTTNIDLWRTDTTFLRGKWGFYRSVDNPQYLRDDYVAYKQFCIAKGNDDCPGLQQVAAPVFSPDPGTYGSPLSVSMSSVTSGASIRYSIDGSAPSCSSGTAYSGPLSVGATTTLRAVACVSGENDSTVTTGTYTISQLPSKFAIPGSAVTASADNGNVPANTVDGSLGTAWAASGNGQWIRYDLGSQKAVSYLKVAWYKGDQAKYNFEIQVSNDGSSFTTVWSGQSSGGMTTLETYDFTDVSARYVRILGHGNTVNLYNVITETEVYGLQ